MGDDNGKTSKGVNSASSSTLSAVRRVDFGMHGCFVTLEIPANFLSNHPIPIRR